MHGAGHRLVTEVAQLIELAQTGGAQAALERADLLLQSGDVDGYSRAGLHYARVIAFAVAGDHDGMLDACAEALHVARTEQHAMWTAAVLGLRAGEQVGPAGPDMSSYDMDEVLTDLATAEVALESAGAVDAFVAGHAHTNIANAYQKLRLYELALPHYERAYDVSVGTCAGAVSAEPVMWLSNLAMCHLDWVLELYAVARVEEAEAHSVEAGRYATQAVDAAARLEGAAFLDYATLLDACARADGPEPAGVADEIDEAVARLESRGLVDQTMQARPFHAVALRRTGRHAEAMRVIEEATALTERMPVDWLTEAAIRRTHAVLLVADGIPGAEVALRYADVLAEALWRQRQRSLDTATTKQSYERLRSQHAEMVRHAGSDGLTGVANRRGLEQVLADIAGRGSLVVTILVADMDSLKELNDTRGHEVGDLAIKSVAEAIVGSVREGDFVARLGGDEFVAVLPGLERGAGELVAERIVASVHARTWDAGTVSVGVATGEAAEVRALLAAADAAMYVAKRSGGNSVSTAAAVASAAAARQTR